MKKIKYPIPVKEYLRTPKQHAALLRLLTVAEKAPPHRLHMETVCEQASCGTVRCLLGWAIIDPVLRRTTNFGLVPRNWKGGFPDQFDSSSDAARTFGITQRQAAMLFLYRCAGDARNHAVQKREVVSRIQKLLRGEDIEPYAAIRHVQEYEHFDNDDIPQPE